MGVEKESIWTCDRCGKEKRLRESKQPEKWLGLVFVYPPLSTLEGASRQFLCDECETKFAEFLFPKEQVDG